MIISLCQKSKDLKIMSLQSDVGMMLQIFLTSYLFRVSVEKIYISNGFFFMCDYFLNMLHVS